MAKSPPSAGETASTPKRSAKKRAGAVLTPEGAGPAAVRNPYEWLEVGAVPYLSSRAPQAEKMAAWGMTEEKIAEEFGLSPEGWRAWKDFPAFSRALARGQQAAKAGTGRDPGWVLDALRLAQRLKKQRHSARKRFLRFGGRGATSRRTAKIIHMAAAAGILGTSLMNSTKFRVR